MDCQKRRNGSSHGKGGTFLINSAVAFKRITDYFSERILERFGIPGCQFIRLWHFKSRSQQKCSVRACARARVGRVCACVLGHK